MKASSSIGLAAVATLIAACAAIPPPPSQPSPLLGASLPGFEAQSVSGNAVDTSRFHGMPLVVSFFSESCGSCSDAIVATQEMYAGQSDVAVVGVFRGDVGAALEASRHYDLKFPVLLDEDGSIGRRFSVQDGPKTFVADRNGWIRWVGGRDLTRDALDSAVASVK